MDDEKYKIVATKVSPHTYKRLIKIIRKKGLKSLYDMLQTVCDTLVRYMDDRHNLTPDMERAMSIFEHMDGWSGAFNLCDPTTQPEVCEAVYFIGTHGTKGYRAVLVERPLMGKWRQTYNVQEILERMLFNLSPERYRWLRALAVDKECNSILELLDVMIDHHSRDIDIQHFRQEFEDADRSEWGIKPKTDGPYKRHHHKDMERVGQQTVITFYPDDTPEDDSIL